MASASPQRKTVAIIGATGKTGKWALKAALQREYNVRVLARSPAKLEPILKEIFPNEHSVKSLLDKMVVVQGSVTDHAILVELCTGADVVMSFLGMVKPPEWIVTPGVGAIIKALREMPSPPKLLSMSSIGLGDSRAQANKAWGCCVVQMTINGFLKQCFKDMQAAEDLIIANREGLNMTIVRASILGDKKGYYKDYKSEGADYKLVSINEKSKLSFSIDRQHVAEAFLDMCCSTAYDNQEVSVFTGARPTTTPSPAHDKHAEQHKVVQVELERQQLARE